MPAPTLLAADIRDTLLRDIQNLRPEADIGNDSDYFVRASSVGSAVEGLYQHQLWVAKQIFPDTADDDYVILHARLRGIYRKAARASSGSVIVTGAVGTDVASGLSAKFQDGTVYTTTTGGKIGADGTLAADAVAAVAGVAGDRAAGDKLTITVPPANVNATVTVVSMTNGTDIEAISSLLARLLQKIRRPPAGGNRYDYWQWAMEIEGVSAAFVYPLRRGPGTVDVVIASSTGAPSDDVVAAAQAHIDDQRPVTAKNALVLKPTIVYYDVVVQVALDGISFADAELAAAKALASYDGTIAPGDKIVKSRIEAVVSDISGVADRLVTSPAANIVPEVDASKVEWYRLRNVSLVQMT
ncbi:phage tail protein [Burkholderia cepacia]|uniref:baseplate J/gp47 family protein n=1 Tax=Burkholderia cepacia TaxID=292 RepID=UPI00075B8499|nr:baseplate J/gp47 family protein [Burkholderia cepacia]KWF84974.1 phage tail protein [Burkholderia cepacia]